MRSLALCLAHEEAYTSLVVGVIFKGIFTTVRLPEWILEISILYHIFSSFCTFCWYIVICHLLYALPLPPSLSFPFCSVSLSYLFVGLRVIGELDSYFFSHHALIFSHAAWLTGSWSAQTELLITSTPRLPRTHTQTHTIHHLCMVGASAKAFFLWQLWFLSADKDSKRD